jgi:hypothetical protein
MFSIEAERAKSTRSRPPSIPLPIKRDKKAAKVIRVSILISRFFISSRVPRSAGVPEKKKTKSKQREERGGKKNENTKARRSKSAENRATLRERFFPQERERGVRKGLMLSSLPEAKNSSKIKGVAI